MAVFAGIVLVLVLGLKPDLIAVLAIIDGNAIEYFFGQILIIRACFDMDVYFDLVFIPGRDLYIPKTIYNIQTVAGSRVGLGNIPFLKIRISFIAVTFFSMKK